MHLLSSKKGVLCCPRKGGLGQGQLSVFRNFYSLASASDFIIYLLAALVPPNPTQAA